MNLSKLFSFILIGLVTGCSSYGQLTFISKLPKKLDENSGIVLLNKSKIWVIEDNGNKDKIYQVDFDGNLIKEYKVKNATNNDWEDLTKDSSGNIYIGDFGNNNNERKDLTIYKIPNPANEPGNKINAEEIRFSYPEQKKFPPKSNAKKYDSEAFFYHNNYLYVITKDRSNPFTGEAMIYKIPASKGNHKAQLVGRFTPCNEKSACQVTAAAISPNHDKIVLLGYGKLWIFTDFTFDDFTKGKMQTIDLGTTTQLEAICFRDDTTLLLSDEERGNTGRNLYSFKLIE